MEYTTVGSAALQVSRIGFGCAAMGGYDYGPVDDQESIRAVYKALDCGITLFDVADVYGFGHAETVLGKALKGVSANSVIATKVGVRWDENARSTVRDVSRTYITQAVEASLRRLQVDRLDICQLHWPVCGVKSAEAMLPLQRMQSDGKIGVLGVCNANLSWLQSALSVCRIEVLQLPCNVLEQDALPSMLGARCGLRMSTFAYNGLAHGLLTEKFTGVSQFPATDLRNRVPAFQGARLQAGLQMASVVGRIALNLGRTAAQVAIRWLLDREEISCVLAGIKTPYQAEVNALSADWSLPEYARNEISQAADILRSSLTCEGGNGGRG